MAAIWGTGKANGVKCQLCSKPATVHLTKLENQQKKEIHLCQNCAQQQQFVEKQEVNLPAILQSLLGQHVDAETDALARLTCPYCGIKYMEFRAEGRLGCPHDYEVFYSGLQTLLKRIHRKIRHGGKAPHHHPPQTGRWQELLDLRQQLRQAVESESYEDAARIRDLLRQKEATYESG